MRVKLFNFMAFQLSWFANVLGAANGLPWFGPLVLCTWLALHFGLLRPRPSADATVIVVAALVGWLADCAQVLAGLVAFPAHALLGGPSPVWMVCLWMGFAATLRHSLGWLRGRWWLGTLLGAVGGPLAFAGGEALGAIQLAGAPALISVAVQFALLTPALLAVATIAERHADERSLRASRRVNA